MPNYKFSRVDKVHAIIRETAEACGYIWCDTYRQGDGTPDAFCLSKSKRWVALEIKSPGRPLTRAEEQLFDKVGAGPLYTVGTPEGMLEIMDFFDKKGP